MDITPTILHLYEEDQFTGLAASSGPSKSTAPSHGCSANGGPLMFDSTLAILSNGVNSGTFMVRKGSEGLLAEQRSW